jgi:hypothetical protein
VRRCGFFRARGPDEIDAAPNASISYLNMKSEFHNSKGQAREKFYIPEVSSFPLRWKA